jgi:hypothetical protein
VCCRHHLVGVLNALRSPDISIASSEHFSVLHLFTCPISRFGHLANGLLVNTSPFIVTDWKVRRSLSLYLSSESPVAGTPVYCFSICWKNRIARIEDTERLKFRVFRLGLSKDGDVRVGIAPEGEEILISVFGLHPVARDDVRSPQVQVR